MRLAILFSGGVDSAYAAYDVLTNTDDNVTLARFDFRAVWGAEYDRHQDAEERAAERIVAWLREKVRPVDFMTVPVTSFQHDGWYTTEMPMWAAEQCREGRFDRVITGHNGEARSPVAIGRRILQKNIFRHFSPRGSFDFPYADLTKIEILPSLPPELYALASSCLRPVIGEHGTTRCRECNKCKTTNVVEEGLAAGTLQDALRERLFASIGENPVINRSGDRKVHARFKLWHLFPEQGDATGVALPAHSASPAS